MHVRAIDLHSAAQSQLARSQPVAISNPVEAVSAASAATAVGAGQFRVAAVDSGSVFHNLISALMQQQGLSRSAAADLESSSSLSDFLQSLSQALGTAQTATAQSRRSSAVTGPTTDGSGYEQGGLEQSIQSLIRAVGTGSSTGQLTNLIDTFKSLVSAFSGNATSSGQGNLTLQSVLEGMLGSVQEQGESVPPGQFVDTYA